MTRRRAIKLATTLFTAIIMLVILVVTEGNMPLPEPVPPGHYRVTEIFDGDTFAVNMNGATEKVRLIGVDTPETHKPGEPVHCFGPESSRFARGLLEGKAVRLEVDNTGDNRDRYDRLLRYAYLDDGTLLNQRLIVEGYGFAYLSFPFTKKQEFAQAHQNAQTAKRGLWAACSPFNRNGRWQSNDQ